MITTGCSLSGATSQCECGFLEHAAANASLPIQFDPTTWEFHLVYDLPEAGTGRIIIRHCPVCGRKAPESKRRELFAIVSQEEQLRLSELIKPLRTVDDVLRILGAPDFDFDPGTLVETPVQGGGSEIQSFRVLQYDRLSKSASVRVRVDRDMRVSYGILPKTLNNAGADSSP